jgi:hypothetical protein
MDDEFRLFMRQSHLIPLITGIWLTAVAGALPRLSLTERRAFLLVWSLIVSGYSLLLAQTAWGVALKVGWTEATHEPILKSPLAPVYIGALAVTALGALIGDVLIMLGAFSAIRQTAHVSRTIH